MKKKILCADIGKKKNGLAYKKHNTIKHLNDFASKLIIDDVLNMIKNLIFYKLNLLLIGNLEKKSKKNFINRKVLKLKYISEKIIKKTKLKINIKMQEEEYSTEEAKKKYKKKTNINSKSAEIIIKNFEMKKND